MSFVNTWKVIVSSPEMHYVKIDDNYNLSHGTSENGPWHPLQQLQYKSDTKTLERINSGDQERCIFFWDRKNRNGATKNSIFAMRIKKPDETGDDLFPWERADDNGVWGAEAG